MIYKNCDADFGKVIEKTSKEEDEQLEKLTEKAKKSEQDLTKEGSKEEKPFWTKK